MTRESDWVERNPMLRKINLLYLTLILGMMFILTGCNNLQENAAKVETVVKGELQEKQESQNTTIKVERATAKRVVDGDTIELADGRKVRLIGVNTPESTTKTEPYGKEASNYTKSMLSGKTVYLEKDVSDKDRYGRLLRIVWLEQPHDGSDSEIRQKMFNAKLVLDGYAEPYTFPPDVKYSNNFKTYAKEAREKKVGLWSINPEKGTTRGDLD